ncbi:MAG: hypothetical protein Q8Q12_22090 [bacterium]|nr:hypothetical protein [bacterium]
MLWSSATRVLLSALSFGLILGSSLSTQAQVHEQHPYRQIMLRTNVKVESSRDKESKYRYSAWGNLSSSDRLYTQKVRLALTITNASGKDLSDLSVEYRVYSRDLARDTYSVAARGELRIPRMATGETRTLFTDHATSEYRLRWNSLVRGDRLSRSGQRYAGYVVFYRDASGPICRDVSSQELYSEYARELRERQKTEVAATPASKKAGPLPYSTGNDVYVTETGRKFHRKDCRFVKKGARPLSHEEALKLGYTPCLICKP